MAKIIVTGVRGVFVVWADEAPNRRAVMIIPDKGSSYFSVHYGTMWRHP